jgi:hypothetical protein
MSFFWGFLFGTIGLGYFMYGKKQQRMIPLMVGLGLMVFPYFVTDPIFIVIVGGVLMVIPYYWRD